MATKNQADKVKVPETTAEVVKTTDKTYAELDYYDEVIVQVGPRMRMHNNKAVEVEPARSVIYTKAGYEAMDRNDEGETTHIMTRLLGIPEYVDVKDSTVIGGKRKDFITLHFREPSEPAEQG